MAVCEGCGTDNRRGAQFCAECGRVLPDIQRAGDADGAGFFGGLFGGQTEDQAEESSQRARPEKPGGTLNASGSRSGSRHADASSKAPMDSGSDAASVRTDHPEENPTKTDALRRVASVAIKAGAKSLALSTLVLGPGFVLLLGGSVISGMLWLFLGSFGLMAWTYRKPWRVGLVSALIPPLVAAICYAVQLTLFGSVLPPTVLLLLTVLMGFGFGYLRAQTHVLTPDNSGSVIAERTLGFLGVWIGSYAVTQLLALLASNILLVRAGLLTGAFTTAALIALSWLLLTRSQRLTRSAVTALAAFVVTMGSVERADAQASICWIDMQDVLLVQTGPIADSPSGTACRNAARAQCNNVDPLPNRSFQVNKKAFLAGIPRSSDRKPTTPAERRFLAANPDQRLYSRAALARAFCGEVAARFGHLGGSQAAQNRTRESVSERPNFGPWFQQLESLLPGRDAIAFDPISSVSLRPADVTAATAAVALVLIAGGIAASVAQSVAAAVAQALQAGVQLTSEEIQGAVADALLRRGAGGDETAARSSGPTSDPPPDGTSDNAPPNVQASERVRPPTPIYDADGEAFETNEQGQYWGPDEKGDWRWLSRREALEASQALRAERAQRQSEQAEFAREAEREREDWRAQKEEEAQRAGQERARAQAERESREAAMEQAETTRTENLTTSIFNALDNMDANERYSDLMGDFATAQQDGDLEALENIWGELRGERQQQLDALAEEAANRRGEAVWSQRAETAMTFTRDGSKILLQTGLGVATGGTATALQAGGAMVVGAAALTGIGAVEGGYRQKDGEVSFDSWEAARGGARGALAAAEGMVGGVATNGSRTVMAGKVVFSGTSSYGTTYADTMDKTGNRDLAASRAGLSALAAMGGAATGEYFDEASRLSRQRADGMKMDAPHDWGNIGNQSWGDAVDSVHVAEKIRIQAGKDASNLLARTLGNIASSDQDISSGQAFTEALKTEALGKVAGKIIGTADTGKRPLTGAQEAVIERLNAERMGLSPQPKPTPEYEDYMSSGKIRGAGAPGASREDYVPADVDAAYTGGFNQAARRHGQRVADNLGVRIPVRPIDPEAGEAIAKGEALAKPPELKANSGKDIDIELGMDPAYRNRVVIFNPELPPRGDRTQEEWDTLQARYRSRQDQNAAYADKIRGSSQFRLRPDGLVVDRQTGLPFTSDMDGFSVTGLYGEPVPRAVSEEAMRQLMRNPAVMGQNIASSAEHREHLAWNIGALDDTKIGPDGKTERQQAVDINNRIVSDLRPSENGPALAVFVPRSGMTPPRMEGAFYTGAGPDTEPKKDG